jgi:DNA-binding MarR family transcriptional regulator
MDHTQAPLSYVLLHTAGQVEARLEKSLAESGLTLAKFAVLDQLLAAGEPLSLSRLAERISCVKSNVTQLVDRLESDGLVQRRDDPADRRGVLATVTASGKKRHKAAVAALGVAEAAAFAALSSREREQLRRLLTGLSEQ